MTRWRPLLERVAIAVAAVLLALALVYLAHLAAVEPQRPVRARAATLRNFLIDWPCVRVQAFGSA